MRRVLVFAVWLAWATSARAQVPVEAEAPPGGEAREAAGSGDHGDADAPAAADPDASGEASAAAARPRVGVMVLAVATEDAALAEGLGEVLLAAIAGRDSLRLVGKEEIQAALGHDDAASLGCLAAPACLGQLGVQLGLGELVAVTLGRRDGGFAFDLGRFDPRSGQRLAHVFREVDATEVGPLADAMLAALAASEEPSASPSARVVLTITPPYATVRIDGRVTATDEAIELEPGEHRLEVAAEGFVGVERTFRLAAGERRDVDVALASIAPPPPPAVIAPPLEERRAPWMAVAIVSGGIAAASGGLALGLGVRSRRDVDEGITRAEALAQVDARRRDARIANASMAVGSVALAAAAVTAVLAWRGRRESVAVTPVEGGAFASFEVRR